MHSQTKFWLLIALLVATSWASSSARALAQAGQGPTMASIGPLAFGPDGTLFAADNQNAAIVALDLGAQAAAGAPGAKGLDALDEKLAALLGTGAREITVTDLGGPPADAERLRLGHARPGRGRGADALPHRRNRQDRSRVRSVAEVPERRVAERPGRRTRRAGRIRAPR